MENKKSKFNLTELRQLINDSPFPSSKHLYRAINFMKKKKDLKLIEGVEIGVFEGRNLLHLYENIDGNKNLWGIDRWDGHVDEGVEITKEEAENQLKKLNAETKGKEIILINSLSNNRRILSQFADNSLDFIYIDGDHSAESVKQDLENWYPKIKEGGIIAGHDIARPEVRDTVDEFFAKNTKLQLVGSYDGDNWIVVKTDDADYFYSLVKSTLSGIKLVGTPCYNSLFTLNYAFFMLEAIAALPNTEFFFLGNESLITRARNFIINKFLDSPQCDRLIFVDADVFVGGEDYKKLAESKYDVIAAPVRKKDSKNISYSINGAQEFEGNILKASHVATGCLSLSRKACEALADYARKNGDIYYDYESKKEMLDIFKIGVKDYKDVKNLYLSEDYWVCNTLSELGFDIFVDTEIVTKHSGTMNFIGDEVMNLNSKIKR